MAQATAAAPTILGVTGVWRFWQSADQSGQFVSAARTNFVFLGRCLLFAFMLESLMVAYVPDTLVASQLGTDNSMALPLAVIAGVPAYLNGYATIPLVRSLIDLGMPASTGLALMLAGSVTSIPAAIAILSLAKARLFALYFAVGEAGVFLATCRLTFKVGAGSFCHPHEQDEFCFADGNSVTKISPIKTSKRAGCLWVRISPLSEY